MMHYTGIRMKSEIHIQAFYSFHYFEYHKAYAFQGESHNFWELVYVDKGDLNVLAGKSKLTLRQGQMIFHKPGEFHNVLGNGVEGSNTVILAFSCDSPAMRFFVERIITLTHRQRQLLSQIVKEGEQIFAPPYNNPDQARIVRKRDAHFGGEQLFKYYTELLLIDIIREKGESSDVSSTVQERQNTGLAESIEEYLRANVWGYVTFSDVCHKFSGSQTGVKTAFKARYQKGVMEFYNELKVEAAKQLMRRETLNFTQISERLSFNSVHYFSRHFKRHTGMTPTQYVLSIKSMSAGSETSL